MNEITPITASLEVSTVNGEGRILDTDLATRLGFDRPRNIRKLIERHMPALAELGAVARHDGAQLRANGSTHLVKEYYLNRKQAIFITAKSETPEATNITIEIIERFDDYENGHAVPAITPSQLGGIVKSVISKQLTEHLREMLPQMVSEAISNDPRIAAVNYRSSLDVVKKLGAHPKGRRNLSRRAGNRLERLSREKGVPVLLSPETGVRLFAAEVCTYWQEQEGAALVNYHNAVVSGQGFLPLRRPQ